MILSSGVHSLRHLYHLALYIHWYTNYEAPQCWPLLFAQVKNSFCTNTIGALISIKVLMFIIVSVGNSIWLRYLHPSVPNSWSSKINTKLHKSSYVCSSFKPSSTLTCWLLNIFEILASWYKLITNQLYLMTIKI